VSARKKNAARQGDARDAKTTETYLAGIGATGALLAGAAIVFVTLVGLTSFDVWPGGGGDGQDVAGGSAPVELAPTGPAPGSSPAVVAAVPAIGEVIAGSSTPTSDDDGSGEQADEGTPSPGSKGPQFVSGPSPGGTGGDTGGGTGGGTGGETDDDNGSDDNGRGNGKGGGSSGKAPGQQGRSSNSGKAAHQAGKAAQKAQRTAEKAAKKGKSGGAVPIAPAVAETDTKLKKNGKLK
jgi:hypothetical protein